MTGTPCILVDIHGTVADIRHRLHFVRDSRDWDSFFAAAHLDTPIQPVIDLVNAVSFGYRRTDGVDDFEVVFCSGRPERVREQTRDWLLANHLGDAAGFCLYMRPDGDTRADPVVKREMLARIRADGYCPFIVIDDRASVVAMWRNEGLVCLQAASDIEPIPATAMLTLAIGPSGAGKTTFLHGGWLYDNNQPHHGYHDLNEFNIEPSQIVSSDELRRELFGDFRDQSSPSRVFDAVHSLALARLRLGLPVVIDATHIRRKDRLAAAQLVPASVPVRYLVFNRSVEAKQATADWRSGVVVHNGVDLITAHDRTFRAQLKDILSGDDLPNVTVHDLRQEGG